MARVLIVDNSTMMRNSLGTILREAGHTVVAEAADGPQACVEFERYKPDLITMDVSIPYMNGLETLKSILSKYPQANIVMVSAESSSGLICDALSSGAKDYIIKPFTVQKLLTSVNGIFESTDRLNSDSLQSIYSKLVSYNN